MTNENRTVLYTGVTGDLETRVAHHKEGIGSFFTSKFRCGILVFYEPYEDVLFAIQMEKRIKRWKREWKIQLIKSKNPTLRDLSYEIENFHAP